MTRARLGGRSALRGTLSVQWDPGHNLRKSNTVKVKITRKTCGKRRKEDNKKDTNLHHQHQIGGAGRPGCARVYEAPIGLQDNLSSVVRPCHVPHQVLVMMG